MSVRDSFVQQFGADEAQRVEAAANQHANGLNDQNRGSDEFRWALLICIGYECISKDSFRETHGIEASWSELKTWIIEYGDLAHHDGDTDHISTFLGVYDEFVGMPPRGVSA